MTVCFRRENHIIFKCINKNVWDLYPVHKKAFHFQRHYTPTIKEYHDISIMHADGQQFTHFASSYLVGSMDRKSSQQLQMWFSELFFAPKLAGLFVTPIVSATVEQIWREKMSEKMHSILLLR